MQSALVTLTVLILIVTLGLLKTSEQFITPVIVYCTMKHNHEQWLQVKGDNMWAVRQLTPDGYRMVATNQLSQLGDAQTLYVADPLDAERFNKRIVGYSPTGYFVTIANPTKAFNMDCSYNLGGKRIGYFDITDLYFIKALAYGYRMSMKSFMVSQLDVATSPNLSTLLQSDLDIIITFVIPGSPFYQWLQTQKDVSLMGFRNIDIDRVRLSYPYIITNPEMTLKKVFVSEGSSFLVMDREKSQVLPGMQAPLIELQPGTETFIDQLEITPDSINPDYRCYGDANIDIKPLCSSAYDVMGMPKRKPTTWDIPCTQDTDCPFFQANNKYPNNRGGCLKDGLCEFPVGIRRVSYRLYKDKPFCYGCDNPMDENCCDKTADFAFANDYNDRKAAGLPTSIAKLTL